MNKNYIRLKQYIENISWILADKLITLSIAFLATVAVSRYLGPEQYGVLAYAVSITGLLGTSVHMGLSGLVVRELVKEPANSNETLGTTLALKSCGALVGFLGIILIASLSLTQDKKECWAIIIVGSSILFLPFQVLAFWFQAHIQAKYVTASRITSQITTSLYKLLLIYAGSTLMFFTFGNVIQALILTGVMLYFYQKTTDFPIQYWLFSAKKARVLLRSGSPVLLGALFASVYLRTDQIMLRWLLDIQEVGIYSIAATISEVWYLLPTAVVVSVFPKLIKLRQLSPNVYLKRLQQLFDALFITGFLIAVFTTLIAQPLISISFGQEYSESAQILTVHIWAGTFIFMRTALSKWILIEELEIFSLVTQGFGAISNVVLNFALIPNLGGYGAAIATVVSYSIASYFSLALYHRTRPVFFMMSRSILLVPTLGFRYAKIFSER